MKNLTLTFLFLGLFSGLGAQYVTIPDSNFRRELVRLYPGCFNANQEMDTTCNAVVNALNLSVTYMQLHSLEGIQYFDNVRTLNCGHNQLPSLPILPGRLIFLDCSYNHLTHLPTLPNSLQALQCYTNQLTSLPALPSGLYFLSCGDNSLATLPLLPSGLQNLQCTNNNLTNLPNLPSTLQDLWCFNNQLTSFPALPSGLQNLNCASNQLTSLPVLSSGLQNLNCAANQLTSLPVLPDSLQLLICSFNQLTSLPALPSRLQTLDCSGNQLTSLPVLPSSLGYLDCDNNQLTSLPALPSGLVYLWCSANQLTSLPALPSGLQELLCSDNQLTSLPALPSGLPLLYCDTNYSLSCLPLLPNTLAYFQFGLTAITCLPNYTTSVTQASTGLPLCNPSQVCKVNPMVRGVVFNDTNNNGLQDTLETLAGNIPLMVSPNNWTGISDTISGYLMKLDTLPTTNTLAVGNVPYRTFAPSSYAVTATGLGVVSTNYDFAMSAQPNITDLVTHMSTWFIRPGFQTSSNINVENIGTIDQTNASISLEIPNGLTVISTVPSNGVVTGNTVTWSGESIGILERKNY